MLALCAMDVDIVLEYGRIEFSFKLDEDDEKRVSELKFGIDRKVIYVDIGQYDSSEIHPDLICLCSILLCNPFVGKKLKINFPMSEKFQKTCQTVISRYELMPGTSVIDPNLEISDGVPGLAFSGGADSTAALAILPRSSIPIFLLREEEKHSVYNPEAALRTCDELADCGFLVKKVISDLEYIRNPVGFPTDLANSIPAILLSGFLELDSISFGTVMESAFGIGHEEFVEYGKGAHWRFYSKIFESAGLKLSMPTIGVSEIGTALINKNSIFGNLSQSCIRGTWQKPCLRCWKCFRKELLNFSLGFIEQPVLTDLMKTNEVQLSLSAYPISHENVIIFSLQRINLDDHAYLKPLADKVDMGLDLEMLNRWYAPSIDFVPRKYRHTIRDNIISFMQPMNPSDESLIRGWNMRPHLESKKAIKRQEILTSFWQDFSTRFG